MTAESNDVQRYREDLAAAIANDKGAQWLLRWPTVPKGCEQEHRDYLKRLRYGKRVTSPRKAKALRDVANGEETKIVAERYGYTVATLNRYIRQRKSRKRTLKNPGL